MRRVSAQSEIASYALPSQKDTQALLQPEGDHCNKCAVVVAFGNHPRYQ